MVKAAEDNEYSEARSVNEVRLRGRVSRSPAEVTLPSGDKLWTFRLIVDRPASRRSRRGAAVDALECSAWTVRAQRAVSRWMPGDVVEVEGAVRRRFFRVAGGASSRVEIEVTAARVIRRAGSA
jgi:single-strand DNA-binding protein